MTEQYGSTMKGDEKMKRIKRFIISEMLVFLLLAAAVSPAGAENSSSYRFDYDDFKDMPAEDIEKCVKDVMELESQDGWKGENLMGDVDAFNIGSYDMEECYAAYILDYQILTEYNDGKTLSEIAEKDRKAVKMLYTTIKGEEANLTFSLESNGEVKLEGSSLSRENEDYRFFSPATLETIVNSEIQEEVTDAGYYISFLYSMTLVQITTAENEYIIPHFINRFDNYGRLESDKVYTETEFFEIMNETFDESLLQPSDENIGSGMPNRPKAEGNPAADETEKKGEYGKIIAASAAAALLLAASITGIVLYNKKKT